MAKAKAPTPHSSARVAAMATPLSADQDAALMRAEAALTPSQRVLRWPQVARIVADASGGRETSAAACEARFTQLLERYVEEKQNGNHAWPSNVEVSRLLAVAAAGENSFRDAEATSATAGPTTTGTTTTPSAVAIAATASSRASGGSVQATPTGVNVAAAALNVARTRTKTAVKAPATAAKPTLAMLQEAQRQVWVVREQAVQALRNSAGRAQECV